MRIILVMVSSVDGKTTHPTIHGWSSAEDQEHFRTQKAEHPVIIMGRKTYDTVKQELQLNSKTLRIVMTKQPKALMTERVPGQLEFTDESPNVLVSRLERKGYTSMLLVGGSETNEAFLKEKLITDCFITIEPTFFGTGKSIFTPVPLDIALKLIETKRLNAQGTLLLHYTISYDHTNNTN
ncbi:MAG: dihydrofolate reductase family protein [Patescibacteria group bacterium]